MEKQTFGRWMFAGPAETVGHKVDSGLQALLSFPHIPGSTHQFPNERLIRVLFDRARLSLVAQMVKNLPAMQETSSILGLGRSPGEGNTHSSILA